jgi:hypothetical protein
MTHDSEPSTRAHIREVAARLAVVRAALRRRGRLHDASKLGPAEKPGFDAVAARLTGLVYGSPEYRAVLAEIAPVIAHHHAANSHHPQHYPDGIAGMDLLDLVEMYCDWAAATLRNPGPDLERSIEINVGRFAIGPQLAAILRNTWRRHGGFEPAPADPP